MNRSQEKVLQYLTGYDNIDSVTIEDLQTLADENPFFPVTQLLLAKKLKAENSQAFLPQVQKTAIYFPNAFWLDYQLNDYSFPETAFEKSSAREIAETDAATAITTGELLVTAKSETSISEGYPSTNNFSIPELGGESTTVHEKLYQVTPSPFPTSTRQDGISGKEAEAASQISTSDEVPVIRDPIEEVFLETVAPSTESEPAIDPEPVTTENATLDTELFQEKPDTTAPDFEYQDETVAPDEQALETETTEVEEEMAGVTHGSDEMTEEFLQEAAPVNEEEVKETEDTAIPENATSELKEEVTEMSEEMAGVTRTTDAATEAFLNEASKSTPEPDEHERMFLNIKAMLDATSEEAEANATSPIIPIDPYYTIDYFASQGIKLELEQNPKDQLGKNLKKFTQWLKHMKKLGPEDATEAISRQETEADIQQIADSSNTVREVVTEAMALVLEKQGKKDKAIELYNKLSFLIPDKSAYFAGKIKNLKGI